jgi:hypothetical protein
MCVADAPDPTHCPVMGDMLTWARRGWRVGRLGILPFCLALSLDQGVAAAPTLVDLELVLAVDVSGSMDEEEQAIQRQGYVEAFTRPEVVDAIRSGPYGRIAVTYVEWAGPTSQTSVLPWTLVDDAASADDFAAGLAEAPIGRLRGTSISGALTFAASLFRSNGYDGLRRAIDVSGDGSNNAGAPVAPVRDAVVASGIVINGLPITLGPSLETAVGAPDLAAYYRDCVIGGPGAFVIPVAAPEQLFETIRRKLVLEIAGLPPRVIPAAERATPAVDCLVGERLRRVWERDP